MQLLKYKYTLGNLNFLNVFHCFYMLSNVPLDAQNNPFAIYMDDKSVIKSFKAVFGIESEELALRFHRLFVTHQIK